MFCRCRSRRSASLSSLLTSPRRSPVALLPHAGQDAARAQLLPFASFHLSSPFVASPQVKTQRALNDYRKSEYPHYKDELTKLKFIGTITAQRLREIQNHLGYDVPFTSIETGAPRRRCLRRPALRATVGLGWVRRLGWVQRWVQRLGAGCLPRGARLGSGSQTGGAAATSQGCIVGGAPRRWRPSRPTEAVARGCLKTGARAPEALGGAPEASSHVASCLFPCAQWSS